VGPQANALADLFGNTLILCGIIFAIVALLVTYAVFKFKDDGKRKASQIEGHTKLEIAWTIAPVLVLILLLAFTVRAMDASDAPIDREPDIVVTAHQWWWSAKYRSGAFVANEIHVPVGKPLVIGVESADVIHDFWVPELARKIDAIPGRSVSIWLEADKPGTYVGACAEYCGVQHAWMRIAVIAESQADYDAWEKKQLAPPPEPLAEDTRRGAALFAKMTCIKCHAVGMEGELARVAPDLTHLASRQTLGAGVITNNPKNLGDWLRHPNEIKPGCHMPDANLSDRDTADLVAYFETLK
jgi:cytochrome c oxidase subunit 2